MSVATSPSALRKAPTPSADPYVLTADAIEPPPATFGASLRRIGPGMVLAASIVGSGELIATTTLGAQVGFTALWIILVSCAIKPVVQGELGRHTIATGCTGLEGFDRVPGPRLRVSWVVWGWGIMVSLTMLQVGGMYGAVSQVLHMLVPQVPVPVWVVICMATTIALLLGGGYARIEKLAFVKVGIFTMLTICAAAVLFNTPGTLAATDFADGLSLQLPAAGLATAMAVFGITGVGATELVQYPYWCVEKGYARFVGPRDDSAAWLERARGWIRVMHLDIFASLAIYTMATIAFYLLGAAILNRAGVVPPERDTLKVLSQIYTETLGQWALPVFYLGAVVTLYGTVFASTAAHSRLFADAVRLCGGFTRGDTKRRLQWRNRFVVLLSVTATLMYLSFEAPVQMVVMGGVAQASMLPIIGLATIFLRHRHVPPSIQPGLFTTITLWVATAVMAGFALYYAWSRIA